MKKLTLSIAVLSSAMIFSQQKKDTLKINESSIEEITIVASTRTTQKAENSPQKVEVLGKEEMAEESGIKPAGIASILGDISGVQIQQSSAVSGNSNVRIQGLDGRYTQILRDGIPLFDGFSGGLGVLSIPPLDLQQVELIKGSASTLYGGGAIGGLVNIISRKPADKQELTGVVNYSTLDEKNINVFASKKYKWFGYTLFTGYTHQNGQDVDNDGFSDVPQIRSLVVHPKLFFYPSSNVTITLGWNGSFDKNLGGDMQVIEGNSNMIHQYYEQNKLQRNTYELTYQQNLNDHSKIEFKNSLSHFNRNFSSNDNFLTAEQTNYFSELTFVKIMKNMTWVFGTDFQGNKFQPKEAGIFHIPKFENSSFGMFIQNTLKFDKATIETGLRNDFTNHYGSFFLPSIAVIYHLGKLWAVRGGIGLGYKVPNALAPQMTDYPLESLMPIDLKTTRSEKSIGYNLEFNYKKKFDNGNQIFINQAFFLTNIYHPVIGNIGPENKVLFVNENKPVISKGFDTYVKGVFDEWELYLGYTFTIAKYTFLNNDQFIPLTPKHRLAMTIVKDFDGGWKFGIEDSFTGNQYRINHTMTPSYLFMAAMLSKELGKHITLVLNCENIFDYRQSKKEPLYSGTISSPTFNALWSPIDGRVVNLSFKWKL
ncbi:TonB-dependent receptor plug domain-containing protein [Chryseobacterium cucumeris]|uniref:TonB-dependent receptor plug domain-containing protein n=1 Tax=Chryseobacterium cucumeris TaxID=1813611 RepID=UPI00192DC3A0|nr:TonB-dependent receptor [Chryseobacterium cucumeris]QRA41337.1 TonB-dependent receptor [Chryseobacterium cucumeris]